MKPDRSKQRELWLRHLVIPFVAIALVLTAAALAVVALIRSHFYGQAVREACQLIEGYSLGLAKSLDAENQINELLDEKLRMVCTSIGRHARITDNEQLAGLAELLEVDEISLYDGHGVVRYSSTPDMIGWPAPEDHPAYLLQDGQSDNGEAFLIEPVETNAVTGIEYLYGYFRTTDGHMVQIGCSAEAIRQFMDAFGMDRIIAEIQSCETVVAVCFIDAAGTVISSTDRQDIGQQADTDRQAVLAVSGTGETSRLVSTGWLDLQPACETYQPVRRDGQTIGTLLIRHSLSVTARRVSAGSLLVIGILLVLCGMVFLSLLAFHRRNRRLAELAYTDGLTGLPNTACLHEAILDSIARPAAHPAAILLVGFKDFSAVNLKFGYPMVDALSQQAARTLRGIETEHIRVFRFVADQFVVLAAGQPRNSLAALAQSIQKLFSVPLAVGSIRHHLIAQSGICLMGSRMKNTDQLIRQASIALAHVKADRDTACAFYDQAMEAALNREETIENELLEIISAPDQERFCLHYQPLVDLQTGRIVGFEALARMQSQAFGAVPPVEFIRIAEERSLIIPLGKIILEKACIFLVSLQRAGYLDVTVAVNLSVIQLLDSRFVETVQQILAETGAAAGALEMEITESVIADHFEEINAVLQALQKLGIRAALDDFGTGYSTFIRLSELNVATLKIDRYFIQNDKGSAQNECVTQNIISMAHQFGLRVVAEGVEQPSQKTLLQQAGCDVMQGYLFSRPLPENEARRLLDSHVRDDPHEDA